MNRDIARKEIINMRKVNGITQKELAKQTGISQSLISKYEKGFADITTEKYFIIREYLRGIDNKTIEEYVNFNLFSAPSTAKIKDVKHIMKQKGYTQIPIIDETSITGSIIITDLIGEDEETPVKDLLSESFPLVPIHTSVATAKMMLKEGNKAILVKKNNRYGIVTSQDLL